MNSKQFHNRLQDLRGRTAEKRFYKLMKNNMPSWCYHVAKTPRNGHYDQLGVDVILHTDLGILYFNVKITSPKNIYREFGKKMRKKVNKGWISESFRKRVKCISVNENRTDEEILNSVNSKYEKWKEALSG